jgi:DNA-binding NarL/FixJ family response regulator
MGSVLSKQIRILIVSLPGMMQSVLRDTFSGRADVELVGVASGALSAVSLIPKKKPDLVVIDSNLPGDEKAQLVQWLKEKGQKSRSLILVETTQQSKQAARMGADIVLRSYSLPDSLDSVMQTMTSRAE